MQLKGSVHCVQEGQIGDPGLTDQAKAKKI